MTGTMATGWGDRDATFAQGGSEGRIAASEVYDRVVEI